MSHMQQQMYTQTYIYIYRNHSSTSLKSHCTNVWQCAAVMSFEMCARVISVTSPQHLPYRRCICFVNEWSHSVRSRSARGVTEKLLWMAKNWRMVNICVKMMRAEKKRNESADTGDKGRKERREEVELVVGTCWISTQQPIINPLAARSTKRRERI